MPNKDFGMPFCVILAMTVIRYTENRNTFEDAMMLMEK